MVSDGVGDNGRACGIEDMVGKRERKREKERSDLGEWGVREYVMTGSKKY